MDKLWDKHLNGSARYSSLCAFVGSCMFFMCAANKIWLYAHIHVIITHKSL